MNLEQQFRKMYEVCVKQGYNCTRHDVVVDLFAGGRINFPPLQYSVLELITAHHTVWKFSDGSQMRLNHNFISEVVFICDEFDRRSYLRVTVNEESR